MLHVIRLFPRYFIEFLFYFVESHNSIFVSMLRSISINNMDSLFNNETLGCSCRVDCSWTWWYQVFPICSRIVSNIFKPCHWVICKKIMWCRGNKCIFLKIVKVSVNTCIWDNSRWERCVLGFLAQTFISMWLQNILLPTVHPQLDICAMDNKKQFLFPFCSLLVGERIFKEVFVSLFVDGHMHNEIGACFGQRRMKLCEENFQQFYFDGVNHGFGQHFHHLTYDLEGTQIQSIYETTS